jgi:hypothetical protein
VAAVGESELSPVAILSPEVTLREHEFIAQTATGTVTGLAAGSYVIGACTANESENVRHGDATGSVLLAETSEGGSSGVVAVSAAHAAQRPAAR